MANKPGSRTSISIIVFHLSARWKHLCRFCSRESGSKPVQDCQVLPELRTRGNLRLPNSAQVSLMSGRPNRILAIDAIWRYVNHRRDHSAAHSAAYVFPVPGSPCNNRIRPSPLPCMRSAEKTRCGSCILLGVENGRYVNILIFCRE